jgi:hypothetical protein
MTISSTTNRKAYTGNGSTTSFSFPYPVLAAVDLKVYVAGVLKTLTTHYTLSGSAPYTAGTNVQFVTAPDADAAVLIIRDPAATQGVDLVEGDPLPVEDSVERPLDKLTLLIQRLIDRLDRAAVLSDLDTSGAVPTLPTPTASQLLGWSSSGLALQNYSPSVLSGAPAAVVSSYIGTLLDDADAATARATLGIGSVVMGVGRNIAARTNSGTPLSKIDMTADELVVKDSTGAVQVLSTVSVTADITASGANGLDTGAEANSTWYYGWVIAKADGTKAALLSTSSSAPTMPSGYTYKALVSAVRNNSGGNFIAYRQFGNRVYYEGAQNALTSTTITTVETTLSVASQVPSIASAIDINVNGDVQGSGGVFSASLRLRYISGSNFFSIDAQSSNGGTGNVNGSREFPNVSQQVFYNWSNVTNLNAHLVLIDVLGFRLPIGGQ